MFDFEYQTDSDLESNESSFKGINRYKKDIRYGKLLAHIFLEDGWRH